MFFCKKNTYLHFKRRWISMAMHVKSGCPGVTLTVIVTVVMMPITKTVLRIMTIFKIIVLITAIAIIRPQWYLQNPSSKTWPRKMTHYENVFQQATQNPTVSSKPSSKTQLFSLGQVLLFGVWNDGWALAYLLKDILIMSPLAGAVLAFLGGA